jgi:hypothetical protein
VHVSISRGKATVALRAGRVTLNAIIGTLYTLRDAQPTVIVLSVITDSGTVCEIFSDLYEFAARAEQITCDEPIVMAQPRMAIRRAVGDLAHASLALYRPFVERWRSLRGRLDDEWLTDLRNNHSSLKLVLVRKSGGRHLYDHFGRAIGIMRVCETLGMIGREVADLPDQEYGAFAEEGYGDVLLTRDLRLEAVRSPIKTSEGVILRARYDRLLLPWIGNGGDEWVMGMTILRERSVVPA